MSETYSRKASVVRPNLTNCGSSCQRRVRVGIEYSDLLLFHELRVGAVVDNILAEDRCCERSVDLLCVEV